MAAGVEPALPRIRHHMWEAKNKLRKDLLRYTQKKPPTEDARAKE